MRSLSVVLGAIILCLTVVGTGSATDLYPWNNHARPFSFLFNGGADIDAHQQTRLGGNGDLFGFLYIEFTGVLSKDRIPVATHVDCNGSGSNCTVGWLIAGKSVSKATLVYHVDTDHPTWLVDRASIPQPGSYSHFHWVGPGDHGSVGSIFPGYMLQLTAVDTFCFVHHDAQLFNPAKKCEDPNNNGIIVRPGVDIATHLNAVGSFPGYGVP